MVIINKIYFSYIVILELWHLVSKFSYIEISTESFLELSSYILGTSRNFP